MYFNLIGVWITVYKYSSINIMRRQVIIKDLILIKLYITTDNDLDLT